MAHVTLLQLNDLHGYLEPHPELVPSAGGWRFERLGGVGPCLTRDNGDTSRGRGLAVARWGAALVPIMKALMLDAVTVHREFAYGERQRKIGGVRLSPARTQSAFQCEPE